ncbi:DgyrCDS370 [Dimorphilus gyrociliatus]|uniref:protein-tyrosine-phosphatase n=1 Tax=Dimorphilus gyrociliatus TaxID=2664684 RepID=A0A7I8V659_9ANNE|nr:DgyrCDS370 [Dimorphilus gyrociliatus]
MHGHLQINLTSITEDTAVLDVLVVDDTINSNLHIKNELKNFEEICIFNATFCECNDTLECSVTRTPVVLVLNLTISNLLPGTVYQFAVLQNGLNASTPTALTDPIVPEYNVTVDETTQTINISFSDEVNPKVTMKMDCIQETLGKTFQGKIQGTEGFCADVLFGTLYKIRVSANRTHESEIKSQTVETPGVKTRPYKVEEFNVIEGSEFLNFTWRNSDKNVENLNYSLKIGESEKITENNFFLLDKAVPCRIYTGNLSSFVIFEDGRLESNQVTKSGQPLLPDDLPEIKISTNPSQTYVNGDYAWKDEWKQCIKNTSATYSYKICLNESEIEAPFVVENSSFNISGLTEFRNVTIRIKFDLKGDKNASGVNITKTQQAASGKPENFTVDSQTSTSFVLTWNPPNPCNVKGNIIKYQVCDEEIWDLWKNREVPGFCYFIEGLRYEKNETRHYHRYNMSVRAIQDDSMQGLESNINLNTKEGVPSGVGSIHELSITNNTISINWTEPEKPNGKLSYIVKHSGFGCGDNEYNSVNITDTNYIFTELSPYQKYNITIIPKTTNLIGKETTKIIRTSKGASLPISNLTLTQQDPPVASVIKTVNVSWIKPKCQSAQSDDISYIITTKPETGKPIPPVQHSITTTIIPDLKPYTKYIVKVKVAVKDESDSYPEEKEITTKEAAPKRLQGVAIQSVGEQNCTDVKLRVTWNRLKDEDIHGEFKRIFISLLDSKLNIIEDKVIINKAETKYDFTRELKGQENYTVKHIVENSLFNNSGKQSKVIPPSAESGEIFLPGQTITTDTVELSLLRNFFENSKNGVIEHRGLLICDAEYPTNNIAQSNLNRETFNRAVTTYYRANQESTIPLYQTTGADFDNIFNQLSRNPQASFKYTIGKEKCTDDPDARCNGKLKSNRKYKILAFIATKAGYYVSPHIAIETAAKSKAGIIAAGVVVPLVLLAIIIVAFIYWKRRAPSPTIPSTSSGGPHINPLMTDPMTTGKISLDKFSEHCRNHHKDSNMGFSEEYQFIRERSEKSANKPTTSSELPENRTKNRYTNISPYDQSRVKLTPAQDDDSSDYINANYIPGVMGQREYIAAQGPLPSTKDDFWRMIWQQEIYTVVMLTDLIENRRIKCESYWPTLEEELFYGDVRVKNDSETTFDNYVLRILSASLGETTRRIYHFKFSKWPDFGCLDDPQQLIDFIREVRSHTSGVPQHKPKLIHCSAGVGRTGTYIAVDRLLHEVENGQPIDVFGTVLEMRDHRCHMVQTEDQYIFVHDCLDKAIQARLKSPTATQPIYCNIENPVHLNTNSVRTISYENSDRIANTAV